MWCEQLFNYASNHNLSFDSWSSMDTYFMVSNALWKQAKSKWNATANHWPLLQINGSFGRDLANSRENYCWLWPGWKNGKGLIFTQIFIFLSNIQRLDMIIVDDVVPWYFAPSILIPSWAPERILFQHNNPVKQVWWLWPLRKMAWLWAPDQQRWEVAQKKKNAHSRLSF